MRGPWQWALVATWLVALAICTPGVEAIRGTPYASETLTVSTTAMGITATLCASGGARDNPALLQIKDNGIYYLLDNASGTPTSNDFNGNVGDVLELDYPSRFRAIRSGAADAKIKVTCFRP